MTGGRAEGLHWNEKMARPGQHGDKTFQEAPEFRGPGQAMLSRCLFSASAEVFIPPARVSITGGEGGEGGREGDVGLLFIFFSPSCDLVLWQDNGRWECTDIRGPLRARTRHPKFSSVTLLLPPRNVCVRFPSLNLLSNSCKW